MEVDLVLEPSWQLTDHPDAPLSADRLRTEFCTTFTGMGVSDQEKFLARLIVNLTLIARITYVVGADGVVDQRLLRLFNEASHKLSSQLSHLLSDIPQRYPDDVFANIVIDILQSLNLDNSTGETILQKCVSGIPRSDVSRRSGGDDGSILP
ncbi:MAG: hypothetical protein JOZ40_14350 [Methylobacteriaceae bacterium]|nr:hypothetical protein [Methylobacteriaceae bacterium]